MEYEEAHRVLLEEGGGRKLVAACHGRGGTRWYDPDDSEDEQKGKGGAFDTDGDGRHVLRRRRRQLLFGSWVYQEDQRPGSKYCF